MAHIKAYGPRMNVEIECFDKESAKRLASGLMHDSSEFGKVEVFDSDGHYVTTAWGE